MLFNAKKLRERERESCQAMKSHEEILNAYY